MSNELSRTDAGPSDTNGDEPAVIYPLVASSDRQRALGEWVAAHDAYRLADEDGLTGTAFDLCIVDPEGLRTHRDELLAVKRAARPVLVPVLLLLSEHQQDVVELDRGEIADNVVVTAVDEIAAGPSEQVELEWRIRALLRLRGQSLELQTKTEELRLFRKAADAAGHAIYITDPEGVIEYVNPAFEEITGYSHEEVLGKTPGILNSGEMPPGYFEELWETVSAGESWEGELVDRRKDGQRYTAYQTVAPITDGDGDPTAFVAVQTDTTERTETERKLEQHRDIVERLADPIMLQDTDGDFELLNEAVAEFAGLPEAELLGDDESLFMDDETAARIARKKSEALDTGEPVNYSVSPTFERTSEHATFSTTRYPYYGEDDEPAGTIAICRDVTELEERTRQLRVLDTVLRHNLRNSLTVIGLLAEQVRGRTEGELAEMADRIVENASDLQRTGEKSRAITDVLAEPPTREPVDIAASVRSLADAVGADRSDVNVEVDVPERVMVSATLKIDEAIEELVRNATGHSDGDAPTLELRVAVADEVTVSVVDDGPGMSEMDRAVLEAGTAVDDLYHGSGLGLWLVYWIVTRSGGTIAVSDAEPRGTRVTVTLPRHTGDDE